MTDVIENPDCAQNVSKVFMVKHVNRHAVLIVLNYTVEKTMERVFVVVQVVMVISVRKIVVLTVLVDIVLRMGHVHWDANLGGRACHVQNLLA